MFQNQQQPNQQEQEEKAQRMAEMKNSILSQVLDQSARTRCKSEGLQIRESFSCF